MVIVKKERSYLSEEEKRIVRDCLKNNKLLPDEYRFKLFDKNRTIQLLWDGKNNEITNTILPFQYIENIDEPREIDATSEYPPPPKASQLKLKFSTKTGRQLKGWTNKLIWGDNKLILSSLKNGPMRKEIEDQGGIKLIYIDPPFDVGADFSTKIEVGDEKTELGKEPTALEELAYRDTWGRGADSFISMLHERLILMKDLLADDGSIYVHCDWRVNSYIRLVLDEIFGKDNFRSEIIWNVRSVSGFKSKKKGWIRQNDVILYYTKTKMDLFTFNKEYLPYDKEYVKTHFRHKDLNGRSYRLRGNKKYYSDEGGVPVGTVWNDIYSLQTITQDKQILGYPTQKPEELLKRIIKASSNENDLIADFFCGSGTTLATAEKLGRRWIGSDLGKFAINTTRKRMIELQRQLKKENKTYRSFELLNLGKYERFHYVGVDHDIGDEEQKIKLEEKEKKYLELIGEAYKAEPVNDFNTFHFKKNGRLVSVGPIDIPVSRTFVEHVVNEAKEKNVSKIDVLGFEFEMGLFPETIEDAKRKGVDVQFKYIPKDVFDKRAVDKSQVNFYSVAHIECDVKKEKNEITAELNDFACFYSSENLHEVTKKVKESNKDGTAKIIAENGQIYRISLQGGEFVKEQITKKWSDWIDYWAVDFDFESRPEIIKVVKRTENADGKLTSYAKDEIEEQKTGNYVFENEWQSFRTKKNRTLELFARKKLENKKSRKVAVKVVDIFGNDTMRVFNV